MEPSPESGMKQEGPPLSLTLVTLKGEQKLESVPRDASVDNLRILVHELSQKVGLECPSPERQRVVYKGKEIKDCTLEQAGVSDGSSFVVVEKRDLVSRSRFVVEKSPSKELIHEMTSKLAAQKGNLASRSSRPEVSASPERSALASINDIQQLLNAITTADHNITDNPLWGDSVLGSAGERGESEGTGGEDGDEEGDSVSMEERESAGT